MLDTKLLETMNKKDIYPVVKREVISIVSALPKGKWLKTSELANQIYKAPNKPSIVQTMIQKTIFNALKWYATRDLSAYATKGPLEEGPFGRLKRPLRWHKEKQLETCPFCQHQAYSEEIP